MPLRTPRSTAWIFRAASLGRGKLTPKLLKHASAQDKPKLGHERFKLPIAGRPARLKRWPDSRCPAMADVDFTERAALKSRPLVQIKLAASSLGKAIRKPVEVHC